MKCFIEVKQIECYISYKIIKGWMDIDQTDNPLPWFILHNIDRIPDEQWKYLITTRISKISMSVFHYRNCWSCQIICWFTFEDDHSISILSEYHASPAAIVGYKQALLWIHHNNWPVFCYPYILQIHYHNPFLRVGEVDTSGLRLFATPDIRENDASVVNFGMNLLN